MKTSKANPLTDDVKITVRPPEDAARNCASVSGYAATCIVHTPSGPVPACEDHADKIQALMRFMGAHTNVTPAPFGAECSNCINEAKRHNDEIRRPGPDAPESNPRRQPGSPASNG